MSAFDEVVQKCIEHFDSYGFDTEWCDVWHECCTPLEIAVRQKVREVLPDLPVEDWEK